MFGKKDKDAAAVKKEKSAGPVKETEPVAENPPQLAPVDTAVPSENVPITAAPGSEAADKPVTSPSPKADKTEPKGGLRGLFRNKDSEVGASIH